MCVYILVLLFRILYKTCELILEHVLSIRGQGHVCYTFGRGLHCDVVIEQDMNNVKVDTLSRIHCTIWRDENLKPVWLTVGQVSSSFSSRKFFHMLRAITFRRACRSTFLPQAFCNSLLHFICPSVLFPPAQPQVHQQFNSSKMNIITKEFLDNQLKKRAFPKGTIGHQFIQSALEKSKCADLSKLTKSVYAACKCFYFHYLIYFVGCVLLCCVFQCVIVVN